MEIIEWAALGLFALLVLSVMAWGRDFARLHQEIAKEKSKVKTSTARIFNLLQEVKSTERNLDDKIRINSKLIDEDRKNKSKIQSLQARFDNCEEQLKGLAAENNKLEREAKSFESAYSAHRVAELKSSINNKEDIIFNQRRVIDILEARLKNKDGFYDEVVHLEEIIDDMQDAWFQQFNVEYDDDN